MKSVYIGKESKNGLDICKVLDSDIATGNSTVYNRATGKVEVLKWAEKKNASSKY